jgi:DNA-binding LacI/PurR family transcriptional regulator
MHNSGPRPKPATLEDIARIAGVHRRTVRDALQGTGRVAVATRDNVRQIARELHYVPNQVARALATGKTGHISIVTSTLKEAYNVIAVQHLVDFLTKHGYESVIVERQHGFPSLQSVRNSSSDGYIVNGMQLVDSSVTDSETILPWVMIDARKPGNMDHILLDLSDAVEEAIRLLIASGRRRIAYVDKRVMEPTSQEVRYRTYVDLMNEAGLEAEIIIASEFLRPENQIQELRGYFQKHGAPGAIFCHNDQIAAYTYRALCDLGYRVPRDTLLAGCDGVEFIRYFETPLSTIEVPWEEVGEMACLFLKQRIEEPDLPVQEYVVKGKLEVRKSLIHVN